METDLSRFPCCSPLELLAVEDTTRGLYTDTLLRLSLPGEVDPFSLVSKFGIPLASISAFPPPSNILILKLGGEYFPPLGEVGFSKLLFSGLLSSVRGFKPSSRKRSSECLRDNPGWIFGRGVTLSSSSPDPSPVVSSVIAWKAGLLTGRLRRSLTTSRLLAAAVVILESCTESVCSSGRELMSEDSIITFSLFSRDLLFSSVEWTFFCWCNSLLPDEGDGGCFSGFTDFIPPPNNFSFSVTLPLRTCGSGCLITSVVSCLSCFLSSIWLTILSTSVELRFGLSCSCGILLYTAAESS